MPKAQLKLSKTRNCSLKDNGRHHVPLPTGRYSNIGCRDIMVGLSRKNGILVRLYYPAKIASANQPNTINPLLWLNWLPQEAYKRGLFDVYNIRNCFLVSVLEKIQKDNFFIPAIPNAKPHRLPKGEKYPVIIFSHGLGGFRNAYSAICCEFASQGFVVAALEHRDNSACLTFYPKRAIYSFKNSNPDFFNIPLDQIDADDEADFCDETDDPNYVPPKALEALTNPAHLELAWIRFKFTDIYRVDSKALAFRKRQVNHRVRECTRALDLIEALNAGYEINNLLDPGYDYREFEDMLDMERISMVGHSFGGATALLAGMTELRFKTVIALDPWMFPVDEPLELLSQPTMMIFTDSLANQPNMASVQEWCKGKSAGSNDDKSVLLIKGSNHFQQCDVPFIFSGIYKTLAWFFFPFPVKSSLNNIKVHDLTVNHSLQFMSKHLGIPLMDDRVNRYLDEEKKHYRPLFK